VFAVWGPWGCVLRRYYLPTEIRGYYLLKTRPTTYGVGVPTYAIWGHLPTELGDYLRSFGTTYLQNLGTTYLLIEKQIFCWCNDGENK